MSFASEMVALLEVALKAHNGLTSIRHPNGATINYESRDAMIKAWKQFKNEVERETADTGGCQIYKINFGKTK